MNDFLALLLLLFFAAMFHAGWKAVKDKERDEARPDHRGTGQQAPKGHV